MSRQALADLILVLHLLIVLFNVGSLPVIWIGRWRGWQFVRNFWFRLIHLLLIGFVAAESVFGAICPLTTWEEGLRQGGARYQEGFVAHWVHRVLYYDIDPKYFVVAYVTFFLLVLLTYIWIPPRSPRRAGP